jgi:putative ABC transport system permease protein
VVGAAWLAGAIQSLLVGVTRLDPLTYVGAAVVLVAVALAAILMPALRATRMDPLIALQAE